ncbi:MAG: DUF4384 domain-containing protein [Pyrinomonadaceae bacterium]
MRFKSITVRLIAFASIGVMILLPLIFGVHGTARAQGNNPLIDDRPVTITRKVKPRRKVSPRRKVRRSPVEQAPLLSLQMRVLKLNKDGTQDETNPIATFFAGDLLRLGVRANQDGYLYIIHQPGANQDGKIIFPDSRINGGQNFVTRNQEFIIPSNCPTGADQPPCALPVLPPAGQEYFTLIFSRDILLDLPNQASEAGGGIKPQTLMQLLSESGQKLRTTQGTSRYAIKIINVNTKDNEEIIKTLVLTKGE